VDEGGGGCAAMTTNERILFQEPLNYAGGTRPRPAKVEDRRRQVLGEKSEFGSLIWPERSVKNKIKNIVLVGDLSTANCVQTSCFRSSTGRITIIITGARDVSREQYRYNNNIIHNIVGTCNRLITYFLGRWKLSDERTVF